MDLFLSKLCPIFVYPLGISLALLLFAIFFLDRWKRVAYTFFVLAFLLLWSSSTTIVSGWIVASLEEQSPARSLDAVPEGEAIVVLGGGTLEIGPDGESIVPGDVFARLDYGIRLFKQGKAPLLVFVGGHIPWLVKSGCPSEAELMARFASQYGIPRVSMLIEGKSRNTRENALFAWQLLAQRNIKRILLVTSALHMPRAKACFEKQGFQVVSAPTDYIKQFYHKQTFFDLLPDADALEKTTRALKEYIGMGWYALRGEWK